MNLISFWSSRARTGWPPGHPYFRWRNAVSFHIRRCLLWLCKKCQSVHLFAKNCSLCTLLIPATSNTNHQFPSFTADSCHGCVTAAPWQPGLIAVIQHNVHQQCHGTFHKWLSALWWICGKAFVDGSYVKLHRQILQDGKSHKWYSLSGEFKNKKTSHWLWIGTTLNRVKTCKKKKKTQETA